MANMSLVGHENVRVEVVGINNRKGEINIVISYTLKQLLSSETESLVIPSEKQALIKTLMGLTSIELDSLRVALISLRGVMHDNDKNLSFSILRTIEFVRNWNPEKEND
ncbi:MAG: hypothetical protein WC242_02070 [Candidatus Paceibacterota bacterium]